MELNSNYYLKLLVEAVLSEAVKYPHPPRFKNAGKYKEYASEEFRNAILETVDLYEQEKMDEGLAYSIVSDAVLRYASDTYAMGAAINYCKKWIALHAGMKLLKKDYFDAVSYAIIADEPALLESVPDELLKSKNTEDQILWSLHVKPLAFSINMDQLGAEMAVAYNEILHYQQNMSANKLDEAFQCISEYSTDDGWTLSYVPGEYPLFEPPICAILRCLKNKGYLPGKYKKKSSAFFEIVLNDDRKPAFFFSSEGTLQFAEKEFLAYTGTFT
jgi:hypothetical protein